jgi:transposase-like protein
VRDEGKTVAAAARALDLAESALRLWVRDAEREARHTGALSSGERKELEQLRREVRTLRMERDILKKAAAFFAKDHA